MRRTVKSNGAELKGRRPQLRALETRTALMDAARRVFARDGFELARLEDIADVAHKTRGAFYDHFEDKEDVFFAIFEEDLSSYLRHAKRQLEGAQSVEDRVEALTRHLLHVLKDNRRTKLFLEFKMYAIRNPRRTRRLAEIQGAMCQRGVEATLDALIPEFQRRTSKTRRIQNAMFSTILDGLTVNRLFDPPSLSEKDAAGLIRTAVRFILHSAG
jgi:AcrR family transcriptional regulator